MRMSCNGCRILRKGCSDTCILRPCLEWIKSPESQANATLFLAKFYGRAGLLNLINAGPEHLRPAIFRSLLYEACGRIVNPIYGSAGLLWSAGWQHCHDAVEAVLNGSPIAQAAPDSSGVSSDPVKVGDIRHVSKEESTATQELHRVKTRGRFKPRKRRHSAPAEAAGPDGSSLSHHSQPNAEAELVSQTDLDSRADGAEIELILRLGDVGSEPHAKILDEVDVPGADTCNLELELRLAGS